MNRLPIRDLSIGACLLALAATVRFFHIGQQPLWVDEGFSWWDSQQSLSNLWNLVPLCDPHPPLYFLSLKAWVSGFGDSAGELRALSALLGVATTALVILAGRTINNRIGWLAGAMFALTPFELDYAREARPYALLCFGAALLLYAGLRLVRVLRDNSGAPTNTPPLPDNRSNNQYNNHYYRKTWILLTLAAEILLWSNDTSVLVLASFAVVMVLLWTLDRNARFSIKPLLIVAASAVVLWLPYVPKLLEQTSGVVADFWIPKPSAWYVKDTLRWLISLSSPEAFWWAAALITLCSVWLWRRDFWREALLLTAMAALPAIFNYLVSETIKPIFLSRTLIGITPAVIVLMAAGVMLIDSAMLRRSAWMLLIAAHLAAMYLSRINDQGNEPWDRIAQSINKDITASQTSGAHANAIVLLVANQLSLPLSHALKELHVSLPLQGAPANFPAPGMAARYPSGKCAPSMAGQDITPLMRKVAAYPLVYFITRTDNDYDPGNGVAKALQIQGFKQTSVRTFQPGALEVHKFTMQAR